jgi:hypothetical protein
MTVEAIDKSRAAWVRSALDWSTINNVKARLSGTVEQAPSHIDDIELMAMSREFFAWWLEARGTRVMPGADDMSPRGLVELLPYFRMLRWESPDCLVFRIFGSALAEAAGFDITGMCTFGEADYPGKAEDKARLKLMHSHPCGLLMHRDLVGHDGAPYRCELINLPVAAGPDGGNRIVGTVVTRTAVPEHEIDFKLSPPLTLRRAVFIDIGFGLPEETGLSL